MELRPFGAGERPLLLGTQFETGIDGTYLFKFDNQFTALAPVTSILNTTFNPSGVDV